MTVKEMSLEQDNAPSRTAQIERLRRLISALNHDLRQPLQTVELLCGVLNAKTKDAEVLKVNARIEETLRSAINLLDTIVSAERNGEEPSQSMIPAVVEPPIQTSASAKPEIAGAPTMFIVDDDHEVREAMGEFLRSHGYTLELFNSCEDFLARRPPGRTGALLIDAVFPGAGMSGLDLLKKLKESKELLPSIMITGKGDISLAVQAMKAGAVDFIEKPINQKELLGVAENVLQQTKDVSRVLEDREQALTRLARLSARERQVMEMVLEGQLNKNIAADLGISQRTVETHRANIMRKMEVKSLPALLRLTMAAA
ncbi:MAG: response regulator [Alphaproteobacteria bacterium]|nr:response regulator [Alphaproteobacteria bacterium]